MNKEVKKYVDAMPKDHLRLFNKLQALIMGLYPSAEVVIWYQMPTYRVKSGWVALANQRQHVGIYTNSADHIAEFKQKYPAFKTGKACINFKTTDPFPAAAIKKVVKHAMQHTYDVSSK